MIYKKMEYVPLDVSAMFYGIAAGPFLAGEDRPDLLDAAVEAGMNAFDTARVYGKAELSMGRWIRERQNRHRIVILSKCAHPSSDWTKRVSRKEIRRDLEQTLLELNTDYLDIYLLHRDDPDVDAGEIAEWMNELKKEGKVLSFGGSNWTHTRIAEVNQYAREHRLQPFTVSSPNFGLADQIGDPWGGGSTAISGPSGKESRDWYRKENMAVVAYSSLAHGFFSGKMKSTDAARAASFLDSAAQKGYCCPENFERLRRTELLAAEKNCSVAQLALSWLLHQDLNVFAAVTSTSIPRIRENVKAFDIDLTKEELAWLDLR